MDYNLKNFSHSKALLKTKDILLDTYFELKMLIVSIVLMLLTLLLFPSAIMAIARFNLFILGISSFVLSFSLKKYEMFSPATLMPLIFLLYAFGPLKFTNDYSNTAIVKYILLQYVGMVGLKSGLLLQIKGLAHPTYKNLKSFQIKKITNTADSKSSDRKLKYFAVATAIALIISLVSVISEFSSFGGIANFFAIGYGPQRYIIVSQSPYFGGGFAWLTLSIIMLTILASEYNNKKLFRISVALFLLCCLSLIVIGERSSFIYCIIFFMVFIHNKKYYFSNSLIALGLFFGILFSILFSYARYYFPQGLLTTLREIIKIIFTSPESLSPWRISEFIYPARSLLDILDKGAPALQFGLTIIAGFFNSIPLLSRFTNALSIQPAFWLLSTYYPEVYKKGGGYGFSPISEAYINGRTLGVFLFLALIAMAAALIYNNYIKKKNLYSLLLLMGTMPIFMLDILRNQFASVVYKLSRIYLLPLFALIAVSIIATVFEKYKNRSIKTKAKTNKNVIFNVIPTLGCGGAENFVVNLSLSYKESGYTVKIIVIASMADCWIAHVEKLRKHDIEIIFLNKKTGFDIRIPYKIYKLIRMHNPSVIHSHLSAVLYTSLSSLFCKIPTKLHTLHSVAGKELPRSIIQFMRVIYRHSNIIPVTISDVVNDSFKFTYPSSADKSVVIYNGVNVASYISKKDYYTEAFKFILVARFSTEKNHALLIDAFVLVVKKIPTARLLLVGEGALLESIKNKVASLGLENNVEFLGQRDDIAKLLVESDCFVMSSDYEGLSISILEAMAVGLPIVTTDAGGVIDIVLNNVTGLVSPVGDAQKLAENMLQIAKKDKSIRQAWGQTARANVVEKYDMSNTAQNYISLFKEI